MPRPRVPFKGRRLIQILLFSTGCESMPDKIKSRVFDFLNRIVEHWDNIPIRVFQDGKWQSLMLSEIKNDRDIADWIVTRLQETQFGKRG